MSLPTRSAHPGPSRLLHCSGCITSTGSGKNRGRRRPILRATTLTADELGAAATTLYECVWGAGDIGALPDLMAEAHSQRDMIWQPERAGGGRERMARGIAAYRDRYPDLAFSVTAVLPDAAAQRCAVEWVARGVPESDASDLSCTEGVGSDGDGPDGPGSFGGVTVLEFEGGEIVESRVYRQAPPAEMHHHLYGRLRGEQRG